MRLLSAFLLFASTAIFPAANAQKLITQGYVTSLSSSSTFDFNGMRVILSPKTKCVVKHSEATQKYSTAVPTLPQLYVGEMLEMTGIVQHHSTEIKASEIVILASPSPGISGTGIIDLMPPVSDQPSDLSGGKLVRAHGISCSSRRALK